MICSALVLTAALAFAGAAEDEIPKRVVYLCDRSSDLTATIIRGDPGAARVEFQGKTWQLPPLRSGSGAKYGDGTVTFWSKGKDAVFEAPGTTVTCSEK